MVYIALNRKSSVSLTRQMYQSLKNEILKGKLIGGTRLPSSRELSTELHVARNVVVECYEQLIAEGYAYSRNGAGTYVSAGASWTTVNTGNSGMIRREGQAQREEQVRREVQAQREEQVLREEQSQQEERGLYPVRKKENTEKSVSTEAQMQTRVTSFRTGIPDLSQIPVKKWAQTYHKVALDCTPEQLDYQEPMGNLSLRTGLAEYLNRVRGMAVSPCNILITNGAAQAFSLLCELVSEEEYVLVENPLSCGLKETLQWNHVKMRPVRLDESGMKTYELPHEELQPPRLVFTTPGHQFPTGVILPVGRRMELIQYARKNRCYLVEDDYDSEFRFDGDPVETMQSLSPDQVIYVGTFSKTLMPSLRIGYMVLPDELCRIMCRAKYIADIHSSNIEQLTLASLLKSGTYELHIRKQKKQYRKKRNELIRCLKQTFGSRVRITGAATGLHLVASFEDADFNSELMERIHRAGIEIAPVKKHLLADEDHYKNALVFGYGNTKIDEIQDAITRLFSIIY